MSTKTKTPWVLGGDAIEPGDAEDIFDRYCDCGAELAKAWDECPVCWRGDE